MKVNIINKTKYPLKYETLVAAGADLRANILQEIKLAPLERRIIPTGVYLELPKGTEAQVRPRSGLAAKFGITVLNAPGTIDADYRGEIGVILVNLSNQEFTVDPDMRIAQIVLSKYIHADFIEKEQLSTTERGVNSFGSTGLK